jgi:hypothetical protein
MRQVAAKKNYKNPRFEIEEDPMEGKATTHWTQEDGKDDTPSPEKKKEPTLEELASAVKEEIAGKSDSPKKTSAETKEEVKAETIKNVTCVEEITVVKEDPAEKEARLNKAKEEEEARIKKEDEEKEARLQKKKEEEEQSNLEYMRRTVLHALDGFEEVLASTFGGENRTVRADSDTQEEDE